ncbi:DUF2283 domain-containing protein, partial [Candidatus Parcubacteria bacterium]
MIVEYYPESDMLYIRLREGESVESEEIAPDIVVDYDAHDRVIGIEIENASQHIDIHEIELRSLP